jgi:hypothetical protein
MDTDTIAAVREGAIGGVGPLRPPIGISGRSSCTTPSTSTWKPPTEQPLTFDREQRATSTSQCGRSGRSTCVAAVSGSTGTWWSGLRGCCAARRVILAGQTSGSA